MYAKKRQSELTVITRANELSSYIMTVTQKSPKQFRFTFTGRLQNASLNFTADIQNASLKNKNIAYTLRKVPKFDRFRRV